MRERERERERETCEVSGVEVSINQVVMDHLVRYASLGCQKVWVLQNEFLLDVAHRHVFHLPSF